MTQYSWQSCTPMTRMQVERVGQAVGAVLRGKLRGLYLHGGLAHGCFNPQRSTVRLLAVINAPLSVDDRRGLAVYLLRMSGSPHPIALHIVRDAALASEQHPPELSFSFDESQRDDMQQQIISGAYQAWGEVVQRLSLLSAYIEEARRVSVTLVGDSPADWMPTVPADDLRAAYMAMVEAARALESAAAILAVCSAARFAAAGILCDDPESLVDWAAESLPDHAALVRSAHKGESLPAEIVAAFADVVRAQIEKS